MPDPTDSLTDLSPEPNSAQPASQAPAAVVSQDAPAESSPAKDESVLDRVKAALAPKPEGSSPSDASQVAQPKTGESSEDEEAEPESDPTEEEQARYHSKTRKQIRRLLGQRNEALDQVKALTPEVEGFRKITGFFAESGISSDEANLLLEVGRNMKRDPLKAWEQIQPYIATLARLAGEVLPTDLQEAVKKGEIAEPYVRQLARSRTESTVLSHREQTRSVADQNRQVADNTQRHADLCASTISTWENNQAKTDPDWNLKQGRIGELIELDIRRNGYPATAQAAVSLADKAKTQVNAEHARFAPRKQAVTPVNPASAARAAMPKPTSALEAARQALAAS